MVLGCTVYVTSYIACNTSKSEHLVEGASITATPHRRRIVVTTFRKRLSSVRMWFASRAGQTGVPYCGHVERKTPNNWNKMKVQWFKVRSKTDLEPALSNTPCKQIQPLSRVKSLDSPTVRGISPVGKETVYGGKDLLRSQALSSE